MALTPNTTATNNIVTLDPSPNDVGGLTASQLQYLFDKFGIDFKAYFNDVHLVEIVAQFATQEALANVVAGGIADGSVTDVKLSGTAGQIKSVAAAHFVDVVKHITGAERTSWVGKLDAAQKGAANGVATLDSGLQVPANQLGNGVKVASGSYTGNATIRDISVGFTPKFVNIFSGTGGSAVHFLSSDKSLSHSGSNFYTNAGLLIITNGFRTTEGGAGDNTAGVVYYWSAVG